jgi:hypothetical protein
MSEYLLESIKNSMKVMVPESGAETNIKALDTSDNPVSLKCTDNGELKISGTFNSGNIVALNDLDQDTALKCTDNGALDVNIINSSLNTSDSNTQSKLDTVNSNLGAIETDIESTNTKLDTVNSNLGAIETDIESTNTKLDTIETSLNSIQTAVETLDNAISGNEMQVDIVSSLPAGTNAIGKLTSNSGIDIGDVDVLTCGTITPGTGSNNLGKADDIAHISGDVGVMSLAVRNDTIGTLVDTNGDYTPLQVNNNGALYVDGSNSTQPVSGSVSVSNFPASQAVTGDFYPETQPVSGSVSVSNFPTTQPVSGSVSVSNFPTTQPVSGSVSVSNFPASQAVTGDFYPETQPVSGSVSVSNFPASQAVTGDFYPETQPVSGSVSVSNFPTTQPVSGSVSVSNHPTSIQVSNLPATQQVSGSVSVDNQITGYATQATLNEIKQKIDLLDGYLLELRNYKWRLSPIYQKGKGNCYQIMDYWYGDANRTLYVHNPVASTKTLFIYNIEYSLGYSDSADHRGTISYGIGYNTFTARSSRNQVNLKTAGGNIDDNTMAGAYQGTESDIYSGTNLLSFHYVQAGGTDTKTIDFQEEHGLMIEPGKGFWIKGSEIGSSNPYFTICVRYMRVDTADLPADWTI